MKYLSFLVVAILASMLCGCDELPLQAGSVTDRQVAKKVANRLQSNQPTPTDIDFSLERFNLIKRAYWVNGQREKARMLPNPIADMPLGYVVLFTNSGAVLGKFVVEGKVTSLQSFLNPESERYGGGESWIAWLPDVDGAYGSNDTEAIFFFTTDGKYIEYRGNYLYSDIPFEVEHPILKIGGGK